MAKQPVNFNAKKFTPTATPADGNGFATPEAVARALGYTEKEQAIANEVLKRFVWRKAAQSARANPNATEKEEFDANHLEAAS
jgi:prophage antirepressor-like protein